MKFIPKKQTDGLVSRYLQAHQYNLNTPIQSQIPIIGPYTLPGPTILDKDKSIVLPKPQMPVVNNGLSILNRKPTAVNVVPTAYPKVQYPTGTWAHAAITGEPVGAKWQIPINQNPQPAQPIQETPKAEPKLESKPKVTSKPTAKPTAKPAAKPNTKKVVPKTAPVTQPKKEFGLDKFKSSVKPIDNSKDNLTKSTTPDWKAKRAVYEKKRYNKQLTELGRKPK